MVKGWSDFSLQVMFIFMTIWLTGLSCDAQESIPGQSHHSPNGFRNPHESVHPGFLGFLKWRWRRLWQDSAPPETYRFTVADNDPGFLAANRSKTTLTWIGHATRRKEYPHGSSVLQTLVTLPMDRTEAGHAAGTGARGASRDRCSGHLSRPLRLP